jgi:hypothetical protein
MLSTFRTTLSMVGGLGCRDFCIPSRRHDVLARPGKVIGAPRRPSSRLAMTENLIGQFIGREIRGIGSQKLFSLNDRIGSQGYHRAVEWTGPLRSSRSRRCNSSSFGSQVGWCGHVPTGGVCRSPPCFTLIMGGGGGHRCGGPSESRRPVRCRAWFTRSARYQYSCESKNHSACNPTPALCPVGRSEVARPLTVKPNGIRLCVKCVCHCSAFRMCNRPPSRCADHG